MNEPGGLRYRRLQDPGSWLREGLIKQDSCKMKGFRRNLLEHSWNMFWHNKALWTAGLIDFWAQRRTCGNTCIQSQNCEDVAQRIAAAECCPAGPAGYLRLCACIHLQQGTGPYCCGCSCRSCCCAIASLGRRASKRRHPLVLGLGHWHPPWRDSQYRDVGRLPDGHLCSAGRWRFYQEGMKGFTNTKLLGRFWNQFSLCRAALKKRIGASQ